MKGCIIDYGCGVSVALCNNIECRIMSSEDEMLPVGTVIPIQDAKKANAEFVEVEEDSLYDTVVIGKYSVKKHMLTPEQKIDLKNTLRN